MDKLLGNVFQSGKTTCLCDLRVEGDFLIATPRDLEEGTPLTFPLQEEYLSFGGDGGSQIVLRNGDGATLYAERGPLEASLESHGSRAFQERLRQERKRVTTSHRLSLAAFFGFFLSCGLLFGLVLLALNWGVDRVVDQIPLSWETKLGDLVIDSGMGAELTDPRLTEPIQKLIDRIAAAEPGQPYTLTLHVVENPQVNAFAAPGGHIVVYTGLLEKTENAEELAGVLAHEFQHVFRRHGLRNMVHSVKWQVLAALIIGDVGSVQQVVLGRAPQFLTLSYGRSLEEQADIEGAKLLARAQINPEGLVDFFKILENEQALEVPEFFSSHPETQKRIRNLRKWMEENPEQSYQALDLDWDDLKKALKKDSFSVQD